MPLNIAHYCNSDIEECTGTLGGATYTVDGVDICFAYTRSHYRAVKALTENASNNHTDITDSMVNELLKVQEVIIDTSNCTEELGWLGCKVWDGDNEFIGEIGTRCNNISGYDTDHVGTGRCKFHGGGNIHKRIMSRITTGLTSKHLRARVAGKVNKYLADPSPTDLSIELATQRALLDELMDYVTGQGDPHIFAARIPDLMRLQDLIGKQVDRMVSIEQKYALTASQVLYVQAVVVDIIRKYVTNTLLRDRAAQELAERLGTGNKPVMVLAPQILDRALR